MRKLAEGTTVERGSAGRTKEGTNEARERERGTLRARQREQERANVGDSGGRATERTAAEERTRSSSSDTRAAAAGTRQEHPSG